MSYYFDILNSFTENHEKLFEEEQWIGRKLVFREIDLGYVVVTPKITLLANINRSLMHT